MIKENLADVETAIQRACDKSNRAREDVTLIAVSKTKPVSMVREAMDEGITVFGENKVQEIVDKTDAIEEPLAWHMIGHLQRNKVKYLVDRVCMIHSVDSVRLAKQIQDEYAKKNSQVDILIEVNVAEEETKFGVSTQDVEPLIREISNYPNIHVRGLMTIAPYVENPEDNRKYFRTLHKLLVDINGENIDNINMNVLSMGMTNDYEIAIEEGATHVRVGTGIFGERQYS